MPAKIPDREVQTLFEKNSASLVSLSDPLLVTRTSYDPAQGIREEWPHMPEQSRVLHTDDQEELDNLRKRDGSWGATLWNAVSWFFGASKYEGVKERPESTYRNSLFEKLQLGSLEENVDAWAVEETPFDKTGGVNWNPLTISQRWFTAPGSVRKPYSLKRSESQQRMLRQQEIYESRLDTYLSPHAEKSVRPNSQTAKSASSSSAVTLALPLAAARPKSSASA